jgi:hypothetical protein
MKLYPQVPSILLPLVHPSPIKGHSLTAQLIYRLLKSRNLDKFVDGTPLVISEILDKHLPPKPLTEKKCN